MKTVSIFKLEREALDVLKGQLSNTEVLDDNKFKECGKYDSRKIGFSLNLDKTYASQQQKGLLVTITTQVKVVEPNALDNKVKEMSEQYSLENEGALPTKKMLEDFKHSATEELLPLTFAKKPKHFRILFNDDGLVLAEGTAKFAEGLFTFMRKVFESTPVVPYETDKPVGDMLDSLITEESDDAFELLCKATFVGEDGRKITLGKESLYDSLAQKLVEEGAYTTSVETMFDGMVTCVIKDDFSLTGIKYDNQLSGNEDEQELADITTEYLQLNEINKVVREIIGRLTNKD